MKIILADNHAIVRNSIKAVLEAVPDVQVVAQATFAENILDTVYAHPQAELLILDPSIPGLEKLQVVQTLTRCANIRIIILAAEEDLDSLLSTMKIGASGYILKSADAEELHFALRQVQKGARFVCSSMVGRLLELVGQAANEKSIQLPEFSERELEVLHLIATGLTNQEIADVLFVSKRTVEGHRQSLLEKTGSRNTASLILYAAKHRLLAAESF